MPRAAGTGEISRTNAAADRRLRLRPGVFRSGTGTGLGRTRAEEKNARSHRGQGRCCAGRSAADHGSSTRPRRVTAGRPAAGGIRAPALVCAPSAPIATSTLTRLGETTRHAGRLRAGARALTLPPRRGRVPAGRSSRRCSSEAAHPSLFPPEQIARTILDALRSQLSHAPETPRSPWRSIPGTVERGALAAYREAGVNRLSLGAQSFDVGGPKLDSGVSTGPTKSVAGVRRKQRACGLRQMSTST